MIKEKTVKEWKKSAKHGAGEWISERLSSLILIPLCLWALISGVQISGRGYEAAHSFVKEPLNAGLLGVLMLISIWHMYMGLKVIIDDYIQTKGLRGFLIFLTFILSAGIWAAVVGALYLVHMGA